MLSLPLLAFLTAPSVLAAREPAAAADASVASDGASADTDLRRRNVRWIRRWAPERNMVELGVYGGVIFPFPRLELFEPDPLQPNQGFKQFQPLAPDIGGRLGYYPSRFLGFELEGGAMPTSTRAEESAVLWTFRGHLVGQIGLWSVTPFVLAGLSGLGVASSPSVVGNDVDGGFHFGGGLKFFLSRYVALRIDGRDTLTPRRGIGLGVGHTAELLLGLSLTLNRKKEKKKPGPGDRDKDGILDPDDKCIDVPGVPEYDGCPIPDSDGDGILDPDDKCIDIPGVPEYDGCPIPDADADGILDPDDKCIDVPGVAEYDGCPIPDSDGDGILDPDDRCVDEPETKNGYEDDDGCPDAVPEKVKQFTGVIEGIYFTTSKATVRAKSRPKLDSAASVLKEFPDVRIEVSGHTDNRGNDGYNMELSQKRAAAVKAYLVGKGVDAGRIETRGAGESEPIESNKSKPGRAKNRRIEFRLLGQ